MASAVPQLPAPMIAILFEPPILFKAKDMLGSCADSIDVRLVPVNNERAGD